MPAPGSPQSFNRAPMRFARFQALSFFSTFLSDNALPVGHICFGIVKNQDNRQRMPSPIGKVAILSSEHERGAGLLRQVAWPRLLCDGWLRTFQCTTSESGSGSAAADFRPERRRQVENQSGGLQHTEGGGAGRIGKKRPERIRRCAGRSHPQEAIQAQGALSLQARADFFNIFNHPNFASPINYLSSPQFGQATQMLASVLGSGGSGGSLNPLYQIGGPRSAQLALVVF